MKLRLLRYGELESVIRLKQDSLPSAVLPPAGSFGALTPQSFTKDTGSQNYVFPAATGEGLTWTYSLVSPPAGVTIVSATRTITFDTDVLELGSSAFTVRATDQIGRTIDQASTFTIADPNPAAAPTGSINLAAQGRAAVAWVSDITGNPAPTLSLTTFEADSVDVTAELSGNGTAATPWTYFTTGLAAVTVDVTAGLSNGESPNWSGSSTVVVPASIWASGTTYSEAITATAATESLDGSLILPITSPAHLAAYEWDGEPGRYVATLQSVVGGPQVLYPGLVEISAPDPGGIISLTHPPFAIGRGGTITIGYRVMLGTTELATSLPYDTTSRTPGQLIQVFSDVSDSNGSRSFLVGSFTMAENPLGPILSSFGIDYSGNAISFNSDVAATVTWRRYPSGYVFANQAADVLAGTGAVDGGSYDIEAGANSDAITFTGGISGPQELWIVARVGSGPISNVIGGPVNITPAGSPLTTPKFQGSSVDGSATAVASITVALPEYSSGHVVILPVGIDCAASQIAGITATGPNGEVATVKQAPTDNEVAGDDGQSIALLYYRATAANTSGSVTISITPGGSKSIEQIICSPNVRYDVKASGDPFGQVIKTFSSSNASTVTTGAMTATSASSRIEAAIVSEFELPPGPAPDGWFMREVDRFGPQSIQLVSRNTETSASESVAAASLPLSTARRWVGLTWELLPLGA